MAGKTATSLLLVTVPDPNGNGPIRLTPFSWQAQVTAKPVAAVSL